MEARCHACSFSAIRTAHDGDVLYAQVEDPAAGEWSVFVVLDDQSNDEENWVFDVYSISTGKQIYALGTQGPHERVSGTFGEYASFVTGEQMLNFELAEDSHTYRNGNLVASKTISGWTNQSWDTKARGLRVGGRAPTTGDAGMNGKIAELIAIFGIPSTAERELVEGYLAHKWGLQGALPAQHTYKETDAQAPLTTTTTTTEVVFDDGEGSLGK